MEAAAAAPVPSPTAEAAVAVVEEEATARAPSPVLTLDAANARIAQLTVDRDAAYAAAGDMAQRFNHMEGKAKGLLKANAQQKALGDDQIQALSRERDAARLAVAHAEQTAASHAQFIVELRNNITEREATRLRLAHEVEVERSELQRQIAAAHHIVVRSNAEREASRRQQEHDLARIAEQIALSIDANIQHRRLCDEIANLRALARPVRLIVNGRRAPRRAPRRAAPKDEPYKPKKSHHKSKSR